MPKLKNPIDPSKVGAIRDITPDSHGPLFNLVEWDEWRLGIEPHLDGQRHRYRCEAHFDTPVDYGNEVVAFIEGKSRFVYFDSSADNWKSWKDDYYLALRDFIKSERMRLMRAQAFLQGKLKRRK